MTIIRFMEQAGVNLFKGISEVGGNSFLELWRVLIGDKVRVNFKFLFQNFWHFSFNVCAYFVTIYAVTITNHKEMKTLLITHVRSQSVRVLINFVGVARLMSTRSCKCKFGD